MSSTFPTSQEYNEAVIFLQNLQKSPTLEDQELKDTIDKFNRAIQTILNSPLASFHLHVSKREDEWVNYLNKLFLDNKYSSILKDRFGSHDKNGNKLLTMQLTTPNTVQLYEIRQKWYNKQGTKIIPNNLILTPDKVLHWYIGDGSLKKRKNKDESLSLSFIKLSTQGFTEEEVEQLCNLIKRDLGITAKAYKDRSIVITHQANITGFFQYIDRALPVSVQLAKLYFPWKFFPQNKS